MMTKFAQAFDFQPKSKIQAGEGNLHGEFPFYTCSPIQDKYFHHADYSGEALIFGTGGNVTIHYANCAFSTSTDCLVAYPTSDILAKYAYYYLLSDIGILQRGFRGSGLKHISKKYIGDIDIPHMHIEVQKQIISAVEKSFSIIEKRNEQIGVLTKLCSDTFANMFITKEYQNSTLDDVCDEIYRYPTFYGFEYQSAGIPVVKIGNITLDGIVDDTLANYDFISDEVNKRFPRTHLKMFDSVMAVRGDGSTAKRIGIVMNENVVGANISPNLLRFSANTTICAPLYLYYFLVSREGQRKLAQHITRTAKKTITATNIKTITIPLPPIDEQLRFQEIVLKVLAQKSRLQASLAELETISKSTLQKAFNGELFQ